MVTASQRQAVPFLYTVKVNGLITHTMRFEGTERLVRDFGYIADLLGPHMGCLLYQLPPSFHYTAARLDAIVGQLDPARRNVVEFRHRSWWQEAVYDAFRSAGVIFCSCSGPRLPDELIQTAEDVYIRFHGIANWYRHDYTAEELALWAARVRERRPAHVWAYFNNDRDAHAIKNATRLPGSSTVCRSGVDGARSGSQMSGRASSSCVGCQGSCYAADGTA